MPATARKLQFTADDLAGGQGGAYAELEVPWEGPGLLTDVNDYDKRKEGKSHGWIAEYTIVTDNGNDLPFKTHLSFSAGARWKIVKWAEAHGYDIEEGIEELDPNDLIDTEAGLVIDFPRDKNGEPTDKYREIQDIFPLVDEDEVFAEEELEESSDEPQLAEEDPEVL